jgi:drug/metabolite transporter (DMT)-like permease
MAPMTHRRSHVTLAYAMVVTGAVLFALNAGVSRSAMSSGLSPETFTSIRVTAAAVAFAAYAALFRRSALRRPRGSALLLVVAMGLVGVAGLQLTYNVAISRLPLSVALLLEYTAPVLVVLWVRVVRREPVRRRMWVAIALALAGLSAVSRVWTGLQFDGLGLVMAMLAAVCFATYFLLGERGVGVGDPLRVILWAFISAAVAMNIVWPVWTWEGATSHANLGGRLEHVGIHVLIPIALVVLLGTVTPFFLQLLAMRHLRASVVVVVAMAEPVLVCVLGWAWFAESLLPVQALGACVVIVAIILAQTARTTRSTLPVPE